MAVRQEDGFRGVTEGSVVELLNLPKEKTALEIDNNRIRVRPDLADYAYEPPGAKPKLLYAGLKPSAWPSASEKGLWPKPAEEYVRLFPDKEMAVKVSSRFCQSPVIVTVNIAKAESLGALIEAVSGKLYRTKEISPAALSGPPVPPRPEAQSGKAAPKDLPGQPLNLVAEPVISHGKKKGKYQDAPDWKIRTRIDRRKDKK